MDHLVYLLTQYRYFILFPLAIIEGPILAVIAGFLCTGGFLNPLIVYPIIVLGDIIGDSLLYIIGRWGAPPSLKRIAQKLGFNAQKINKARAYFDAHPNKTVSLSKITLGIGVAGIYLAGNAKIPYFRFLQICFVTSALQYIVYLGIGLLFGSAYQQINHYLNVFAAGTLVTAFAIVVVYFIKSIRSRL